MIEEFLKVGLGVLVGTAIVEALDDKELENDIKDIAKDIRNLPNELMAECEEPDEFADSDKIEQTIENFKRAVNPVTRFVDHCLSMDVNTAKKVLKKGDHIYCVRSYYSHHGIYDGEGGVYHYSNTKSNDNGWLNDKDTMVSYSSLEAFVNSEYAEPNSKINVRYYKTNLTGDEIISRCKERLGEQKYDALFNNCEHFAYWARGYENFGN